MAARKLAGLVVAITGASSGIGEALALALGPHHTRQVLGARRVEKLQQVAERVRAAGSEALVVPCDVAVRAQVQAMVAAAVAQFGQLDVMVANAGFGFLEEVARTSDAQMEEIIRVNLLGTWYAMAEAIAVMRPRRQGHVIVVSSAAARRSLPLLGAYAMTKAAQLSLAEAARAEMRSSGVVVSSVHPISTATEFFDVASARSRVKIGGLGPVQPVEKVAQKMVRLIQHPQPELWPFGPARYALGVAAVLPRVADYVQRRFGGR